MSLDCSPKMQKYFDSINSYTKIALDLAQSCRKQGYDPKDFVEISLAKNAAERVVGLISILAPQIKGSGVTKRISDLEKKYGALDWRVAMVIAHEISQQKYCKFKNEIEAIEIGVRTGFAYVTLGIVSSPIEGLTNIELVNRRDGKGKYFKLKYSGPIRNAGGTMAAVSALIADYVRKKLGYAEYDADEKEIKRTYAELEDYHGYITNLQYFPSKEEAEFLTSHLPIEISGDPTESRELSSALLKDLPRVETNLLRSGFCLMHSSCIPLKAPKLWKQLSKWGNDFDLEQWNFLEEFIYLQKKMKAKGQQKSKSDDEEKIKPDGTFVKDIVAGRPVFGYPMRSGGFRLRYGRARVSGYSGQCIHPATMQVMDGFIALGTQAKVERPGKGAAFMSTDYVDGPIVKLKDGSVLFLEKEEDAKKVKKEVQEIIYNGDVLINYGDFLDRAHILAPPGYCQEFWILEFEKKAIQLFGSLDFDKLADLLNISSESLKKLFDNPIKTKLSAKAAFKISKILKIPLHPRYDFYWNELDKNELMNLFKLIEHIRIKEDKNKKLSELIFNIQSDQEKLGKRSLELLGIPHLFMDNKFVVLDKDYGYALLECLNIDSSEDSFILQKKLNNYNTEKFSSLKFVNEISSVFLRDKSGIFIGARMGRPEKAKMRKMKGSPHGLFPIGEEGGKLRSLQTALCAGKVTADFHIFWCSHCKKETIFSVCDTCGKKLKSYSVHDYESSYNKDVDLENRRKINLKNTFSREFKPVKRIEIPIKKYFDYSKKIANMKVVPDLIKAVKGTFNEDHYTEHLAKALLRAKHKIYVNKDGTTRYDCSEITLTHFKPKEIHTSVEKLIELGYTHDVYGDKLINENQILELKVQDIVIPACPDSPEEESTHVLFRTGNFIDDLLINLYNQKPFYNFKDTSDIIGHLVIGLAPHTSAGIIGRIIGYSKSQGFLAHPLYHAAMRRDCDGDESCFLLLMDGFLNFSTKYLPSSRGSTMDAPIVLTALLDPAEVDDMAFNVDRVFKYPLKFYDAAINYKYPWDIKIQIIQDVLNTPQQFEGMGFTHDSTNINSGILCSAYKILPSMEEKLEGQLGLGEKIRAVDESKVAQLVIEKHFIRDTKGNLRKFSMQEFRCANCNTKFRRPPLRLLCPVCKTGKIIFTISEGSVIKYLGKSLKLAEKYNVPLFLKQTLDLLNLRVEDVFGKEKEKQVGLSEFFV